MCRRKAHSTLKIAMTHCSRACRPIELKLPVPPPPKHSAQTQLVLILTGLTVYTLTRQGERERERERIRRERENKKREKDSFLKWTKKGPEKILAEVPFRPKSKRWERRKKNFSGDWVSRSFFSFGLLLRGKSFWLSVQTDSKYRCSWAFFAVQKKEHWRGFIILFLPLFPFL